MNHPVDLYTACYDSAINYNKNNFYQMGWLSGNDLDLYSGGVHFE
jgi:hypothetical protein